MEGPVPLARDDLSPPPPKGGYPFGGHGVGAAESDSTLMSGVPSPLLLATLVGVVVLTHLIRSAFARSARPAAKPATRPPAAAARPAFEGSLFIPRVGPGAGTGADEIREEYQAADRDDAHWSPTSTGSSRTPRRSTSAHSSRSSSATPPTSGSRTMTSGSSSCIRTTASVRSPRTRSTSRPSARIGCEYRLRTRDGRWKWFLDEAVIVRDADGAPVCTSRLHGRHHRPEGARAAARTSGLPRLAHGACQSCVVPRPDRPCADPPRSRARRGLYLDLDDFKAVNDSARPRDRR